MAVMTEFMKEKIRKIYEYIDLLDEVIEQSDIEKAKALQTEIIAVYEPEIISLTRELDNYKGYWDEPVDFIGDAKLLKAKLENYKLNLGAGLYKPFQGVDGSVTVNQQVNQDISTTVSVVFEQAINNIQELPASVLSDADKEILAGKIASISAEKDKEKLWEKVSNTLKWIADKGIEVGIAALPYIVQYLGA